MAKCRHGMDERWCTYCMPLAQTPSPAGRGVELYHDDAGKPKASPVGQDNKKYEANLAFMSNLPPELQRKFDEMVELGLDAAKMALDYFGLGGRPRLTQAEIGQKYGYTVSYTGALISAVVIFLDPEQPATVSGRKVLPVLKRQWGIAKVYGLTNKTI